MRVSVPALRGVLPIVLLLVAHPASAQPEPVRLSPDLIKYVTHDRGAMQAAATIGNTTLAVWANSVFASDSAVVNHLRMQIIRDGEPVGAPTTLTDRAARPHTAMAVAALADRFLVIWNDERVGAAGIYGVVVMPDGNSAGPAVRLSMGRLRATGEGWMTGGAGRYGLYWNDNRNDSVRLYQLFMDVEGRPLEVEEDVIRAGAAEVIVHDPVRSFSIVLMKNDERMIVDSSGAVATDVVPDERLSGCFHFGSDGSFAQFRNDTLFRYETPASVEPSAVYLFDAGADSARYRTDLALLCRNESGTYLLIVPRVEILFGIPPYFLVRLERFVAHDGMFARLDTVVRTGAGIYVRSYSDGGSRRYYLNGGECAVGFRFGIENDVPASGMEEPAEYFRAMYRFDRYGNLIAQCSWSERFYPPAQAGPDRLCILPYRSMDRTDLDSAVTLHYRYDGEERTITEMKAFRQVNLAERNPAVFVRNDSLAVAWVRSGSEPTYVLLSYNRATGLTEHVAATKPEVLFRRERRGGTTTDWAGWAAFRPCDEGGILSYVQNKSETYKRYPGVVYRSGYAEISLATPSGWKTIYRKDGSNGLKVKNIRRDPVEHKLLILTSEPGIIVVQADTVLRHIPYRNQQAVNFDIIPLNGDRYYPIENGILYRGDSGYTGPMVQLVCPECEAAHHRLDSGHFVRIYNETGNPFRRLAFYDLTGNLLGDYLLETTGGFRDATVIGNPANGTLILLGVDNRGIVGGEIDSDLPARMGSTAGSLELPLIFQDSGAIHTPHAVVVNDTLTLVWRRSVDGQDDIYTVSLPMPDPPVINPPTPDDPDIFPPSPGPGTTAEAFRVSSASPNPARHHILLRIEAVRDLETQLSIFNSRGERVEQHSFPLHQGKNILRVDLSPYGGIFLIRLCADGNCVITPVAAVGD